MTYIFLHFILHLKFKPCKNFESLANSIQYSTVTYFCSAVDTTIKLVISNVPFYI